MGRLGGGKHNGGTSGEHSNDAEGDDAISLVVSWREPNSSQTLEARVASRVLPPHDGPQGRHSKLPISLSYPTWVHDQAQ